MGIRAWPLRSGTSAAAGSLVVVALMLFVVPGGAASATPAPTSSPSIATWAYGEVVTNDFKGTSANGIPYQGNATYGYTVLIHQTNLSGAEFQLSFDRTMGALISVEYCYPSCNSPRYYADLSVHEWETVNATSVLTDAGTVYEAGTPVPAYALVSSTTVQTANLDQASHSYRPILGGAAVSRSGSLNAQVVGSAVVTFDTPLGLFPTNLTSSQSWNSTAAFDAQVNASYSYVASHAGPLYNLNASGSGYFPVEATGNVSVQGNYSTSNSIVLGGVTYPEIGLSVQGPFTLREGFILVPTAVDLFQGMTTQPWAANTSGQATAGMSYLDVRPAAMGHFGLGASKWLYDSQTLDPTSVAPPGTGITDLGGGVAPDTAPQTVVQGQPQTVADSSATQACLVSGSGCPPGASTLGPLHGLFGLLALGVVVVVVLALVVAIAERRRIPPPSYPNSSLYPPGGSSRPLPTRSPSTPDPPPEEDPLGNLW
jgi:hypothetical protein